MIIASPQMADRLRKIKLRPVTTSPATAIIIDKLHKRISAYNDDQPRDSDGRWGSGGTVTHDQVHQMAGTDKLTESMSSALQWYQSGGDRSINGPLRSGTMTPEELRDESKQWIGDNFKDIEQAFNSVTPLPKDIVLYRGVSPEYAVGLKDGKEVTDKGFMSTTTSKDFADKASRGGTRGATGVAGTVIAIRIPAGTRVLPMQDLNGEQEVLLDRGTKLKFTSSNTAIMADGSINWTSPSGPIGPDWYDAYIGTSPIPNDHPPSLKNPKLTKIPTAQDGWKKGDSKKAKDQAMDDLVEIHKRLRRQIGKPEISFPAKNPVYPTGVTGSAKGRK
jgi:hypothetical protein